MVASLPFAPEIVLPTLRYFIEEIRLKDRHEYGFEATFKVAPQYYYTVRSAEIVVNQLAKVGIRAKIQQIEWGQWLAQVFCLKPCENPDYDMSIIGHAEAWDIGNFANPKYYFRWDSPEFQALFKESEATVDDKKRRELYVKMQQMLADEAPAVPRCGRPSGQHLHSDDVEFCATVPTYGCEGPCPRPPGRPLRESL